MMAIQSAASAASTGLLKSAATREKYFEWTVAYTDSSLWNPATNSWDKVRLRSYQGAGIDTKVPFAAPTIVVAPGDTVRATLKNRLPKDENCFKALPINEPHCFNSTNMHTHGLWINPAGNSDNVLISINPGVDFSMNTIFLLITRQALSGITRTAMVPPLFRSPVVWPGR